MSLNLRHPAYRFGSTITFLMFVSWAVWWSFYQLWLTSEAGGLMLSGQDVGTVYAIHGIGSVVAMLAYGAIQDKLDLGRQLTIGVAIAMSLTGPFVTWVYRPLLDTNLVLGAIVGAAFLATSFTGSIGLMEAYVDRLSRRTGFEFGQARMWGSAGFALATFIAGFVFTVNPNSVFWIASLVGLLLLGALLFWKLDLSSHAPADTVSTSPSLSEIAAICRDRKFWAFVLFVLLSWTIYSIFESQMFPSYYTGLYESDAQGQRVFGLLTSAQTLAEAVLMGIVPLIFPRVGVRNCLVLAAGVMLIPVLGSALSTNVVLVSIAKLFHALMVPLIILAVMKYIALHFSPRFSATIFLVGFYVTTFGASSILSNPLGRLRDTIGYTDTFFVLAGIIALAALVARFMLRGDDVKAG